MPDDVTSYIFPEERKQWHRLLRSFKALLVSKAKVVASKAVASLGSQWAKSKLAGCSDTFAMFESATYLSRTRPMLLGAS